MKSTILIIIAGLALAAAGYLAGERKPSAPETAAPAVETPAEPSATAVVPAAEPMPATPARTAPPQPPAPPRADQAPAHAEPASPSIAGALPPVCRQAVDTLLLPQASYEQKQQAFKQLKDSGRLDQAITELERGAGANPKAAEYPAALGQAYLQKAGTVSDLREQGVLGLKADQTFEAALQLDPSNWDARYWKTFGMTFWPPQMGKGQEVVENFTELIRQQESQPPQPQFARPYVLLGEQYAKQGNADYARQVWQRGLVLHPGDAQLTAKLTPPAQ